MSTLGQNRRKGQGKKTLGGKKKPRPPERAQKGAVKKMIEKFEQKLDSEEFRISVGDYLRLVQFQSELEAEDPKEIKVTWVEPTEKESSAET